MAGFLQGLRSFVVERRNHIILLKVGGRRSTSFEAENILPIASSPPKGNAPLSSNIFIDGFDRFNNLLVSCAPAEVTGNGFLHLFF